MTRQNNSFKMPALIAMLLMNFSVAQSQTLTNYINNLTTPQSLALSGTTLYFSEQNGKVSKVDLTESNPTPVIVANNSIVFPTGIALNGTDLYIGDANPIDVGYDGKIFKLDLSVANAQPIEILSGLRTPSTIKVFQGHLYYSEINAGARISKLNLSVPSATPEVVYNAPTDMRIYGFEIFGNDLYYCQGNPVNQFIIRKIDLASSSPTPVTVIEHNVGSVASHRLNMIGNYMYVSDIIGDKILRFDPANNTPTLEVVVQNVDGSKDCLAYANDLYIAESVGNRISKLSGYPLSVDTFANKSIQLYPNPVDRFLRISNLNEPVNYKIINVLGQQVMVGHTNPDQLIDVNCLEKGTYILKIDDSMGKKFMKN